MSRPAGLRPEFCCLPGEGIISLSIAEFHPVLRSRPCLIFLLLACGACSGPAQEIEIPFIVTWDGVALGCEDEQMALTDLRFYASDIELLANNGEAHLLQDLVLIDLESGLGSCQNGTTDVITRFAGSVPTTEFEGLRFTLGVPFEQNHADPLKAAPPLDDPAMHWHWRSGYKFLRAGVRTPSDGFWIHVGSAGCEGTVRNVTGCRFPNRVTVELRDFDPLEQAVMIDLGVLFRGVDLADGEPGNCSSGPPELTCVAPFRALGIDFSTGERVAQQQVFSAYP